MAAAGRQAVSPARPAPRRLPPPPAARPAHPPLRPPPPPPPAPRFPERRGPARRALFTPRGRRSPPPRPAGRAAIAGAPPRPRSSRRGGVAGKGGPGPTEGSGGGLAASRASVRPTPSSRTERDGQRRAHPQGGGAASLCSPWRCSAGFCFFFLRPRHRSFCAPVAFDKLPSALLGVGSSCLPFLPPVLLGGVPHHTRAALLLYWGILQAQMTCFIARNICRLLGLRVLLSEIKTLCTRSPPRPLGSSLPSTVCSGSQSWQPAGMQAPGTKELHTAVLGITLALLSPVNVPPVPVLLADIKFSLCGGK